MMNFSDEDNCQINLCRNGGTCVDRLNGFDCDCLPGFSGFRCQQGKCQQIHDDLEHKGHRFTGHYPIH